MMRRPPVRVPLPIFVFTAFMAAALLFDLWR